MPYLPSRLPYYVGHAWRNKDGLSRTSIGEAICTPLFNQSIIYWHMKLTLINPDKVVNGKKSISLTVNNHLDPTGKSANDWDANEYPDGGFWSLLYFASNGVQYEFEFQMNDDERTLVPIKGLVWDREVIDTDFLFTIKQAKV